MFLCFDCLNSTSVLLLSVDVLFAIGACDGESNMKRERIFETSRNDVLRSCGRYYRYPVMMMCAKMDHVILLMCTRRKTNNTVDTERRSLQGDVPRIFYSNYYIRLSRLKSNWIQKSTVNDRRAGIHARTGGPVTRVSHSPSLNLAEVIILSLHHTMIIVK